MTFRNDLENDDVSSDPRRCSRHNFTISSPDGRFDGTCPKCEMESDAAAMQDDAEARRRDEHIVAAERRAEPNPEACPGCGCLPGDGLTYNCDDPDGCGYFRALAEELAAAAAEKDGRS